MLRNLFGRGSPALLPGLILLFTFGAASAQDHPFQPESADYLWPTDASTYISSTFGETRTAHFHAGLDIRTWGQEGYRVFASRDGYLNRIGISPWGYGNVIYLKHDDDSYTVYAHLNRFEPAIQHIADSLRLIDFSSDLDRVVRNKNIRFRQGDVIGYTGSTGAGPPHLHFEIRSPGNEAVNPLLTNIRVEDTLPPVFSSLGIEHLSAPSLHTGRIETRRPSMNQGVYQFGTIRAEGPVGLSVDVYDRANRTPNVYAVYSLTMVHEGDTLFHSRADQYPMESTSAMLIDRVYPLLRQQRQGFQRLFVVNGNELTNYRHDQRRGILDLPPGEHPVTIIAADFYGNESRGVLNLDTRGRTGPPMERVTSIPAYPKPVELAPDEEMRSELVSRVGRQTVDPVFFMKTAAAGPSGPTNLVSAPLRISREPSQKTLRKRLVPGKRQVMHLPDQTFWLDIPADALFDTLDLQVIIEEIDGLPSLRFSPEMLPLKNRIAVNLILPPHLTGVKAGLYRRNPQTSVTTFLAPVTAERFLRAELSELQHILVQRDETPPVVGNARFRRTLGNHDVITISTRDPGSGIDHRASRIEVNGEPGIVEYNPDRNELIYYHPAFTPRPENEVEAWIYDGAGNLSHRTFRLNR